MSRGRLLIFGGAGQTSKSDHARDAVAYLKQQGIPVFIFQEPKGEEPPEMNVKTRLLLDLASREEYLENMIRPELESGTWVVMDGFFDSTFLRYGREGVSDDMLLALHRTIGHCSPVPDFHFLFTRQPAAQDGEEEEVDPVTQRIREFAGLYPHSRIFNVTDLIEEEVFDQVKAKLDVLLLKWNQGSPAS